MFGVQNVSPNMFWDFLGEEERKKEKKKKKKKGGGGWNDGVVTSVASEGIC